MREIAVSWGSAVKVAWSIAWRLALYLVPAYALGAAIMVAAMMAGDSLQGPVVWGILMYYVLQALWLAAVLLAFLFAVRNVLGKSYSSSSSLRIPQGFRVTLIAED